MERVKLREDIERLIEEIADLDEQKAKVEEDLAEKRTSLQELEWGGDSKKNEAREIRMFPQIK